MPRIVYVNGAYLPYREAGVHVEDRGFQFADAVYEVCEIKNGFIVDQTGHLDRLDRSLRELAMAAPMGRPALALVIREVVRRNGVRDGLVYLQVSRGVSRRDFLFPGPTVPPTLVISAKKADPAFQDRRAETGISVVTVPENRWDRVDIKTVGLLPNVLAKEKARAAGAQEALFVDRDGNITEGGSSNFWIVDAEGALVTRQAEHGILRGITRTTLLDVAKAAGVRVIERPIAVDEARAAREAFITSATTVVMPVVAIDGRPVANGHPGSLTGRLRAAFFDVAEKMAT